MVQMCAKQWREADYFDKLELAELESRNGYRFYLEGEPFPANANPSAAFMEGWNRAKAEHES
jgi:hypothetical protein